MRAVSLQEIALTLRPVPPLCPAGPGPSLSLRAFVVRKAKQLAFRPLRGPLLTPLKEGDWTSRWLSPAINVAECAERLELLISPLEGEMAGRPERGAWAPSSRDFLSGAF
ncbi:MAG: hypothetical protein EOS63_28850 [Mesorhizobium sp.]|nr:MAG: hypothetical protein EOS63_28850 [Mesorhizobium sp.]TIT12293.1 MAG: hypothetical protein E5W74_10205 [Mesorhizobium sp.]TJW59948.1 MAG: hypothetical protein E5V97_25940 [Mesorhizobium sp.]